MACDDFNGKQSSSFFYTLGIPYAQRAISPPIRLHVTPTDLFSYLVGYWSQASSEERHCHPPDFHGLLFVKMYFCMLKAFSHTQNRKHKNNRKHFLTCFNISAGPIQEWQHPQQRAKGHFRPTEAGTSITSNSKTLNE